MDNQRFILFDTETCGLDYKTCGICEVAWIEIDQDTHIIDQDCSLIDPEMPIPAALAGIHGISDADVADAPTMEEYITLVKDDPFAGDIVFIAHNAPFDVKFLDPYIENIVTVMCTLKLARKLYPDVANHKLPTLRAHLGLPFNRGQDHSAAGDTNVVLHLIRRMMFDFGMTLAELIEMAQVVEEPKPLVAMPFGKHKDKKFGELPKDYVEWILKQDWLKEDLRKKLEVVV